METKLCPADEASIQEAGALIARGELIGLPTETVYGLGADASNGEAVKKIFAAKGRPQDNPLIVHIWNLSQLDGLCREIPETALRLAEAFWPGPLTIIMKKQPWVPKEVTAGLDTVAVRMPSHPVAYEIIKASKTTIAAPSANLSGKPSPTKAIHVWKDLHGKIPLIVDGGDCDVGVESTVITVAGDVPVLLRPGGITLDMLCSVVGRVDVHPAVAGKLEKNETATSPGMKYKHYAPGAEVTLLDGSSEKFVTYVNTHCDKDVVALCFDEEITELKCSVISLGPQQDVALHAHRLFAALRQLDDMECKKAYGHLPGKDGMGLAVLNRLIRAAAYKTVKL